MKEKQKPSKIFENVTLKISPMLYAFTMKVVIYIQTNEDLGAVVIFIIVDEFMKYNYF